MPKCDGLRCDSPHIATTSCRTAALGRRPPLAGVRFAGCPMDPALAALREHFGFTSSRPGQAEAVEAAVAGNDLLVVMPTGAGKSMCYQLPAVLQHFLPLVVSAFVS